MSEGHSRQRSESAAGPSRQAMLKAAFRPPRRTITNYVHGMQAAAEANPQPTLSDPVARPAQKVRELGLSQALKCLTLLTA